MKRVSTIPGIGPVYRDKLQSAGIATVADLIERCGTPLHRQEVASATGLREQQLLTWVQIADLMRIHGVEKEYSQLLDAAGVRSVAALSARDPELLQSRMSELNTVRKLARHAPALHQVSSWIAAANTMERRVY